MAGIHTPASCLPRGVTVSADQGSSLGSGLLLLGSTSHPRTCHLHVVLGGAGMCRCSGLPLPLAPGGRPGCSGAGLLREAVGAQAGEHGVPSTARL